MRKNFYPRPPRGGRPTDAELSAKANWISIHALREEGDAGSRRPLAPLREFLSTPSARRATPEVTYMTLEQKISIHALREEGDFLGKALHHGGCSISIHALREEGDRPVATMSRSTGQFLSTPSARRATRLRPRAAFAQKFLSTPSARRATLHRVV